MSKSTPDAVERDLKSSLRGFRERADAVKDAHRSARQAIVNDVKASDLGKRERLDALKEQTRSALDAIKGEQASYVSSLSSRLDQELRGTQPTDANSVLLRRDAADRARKITDEKDALAVLGDAARSGDVSLADAVGYRARQSGWIDALDAYRHARPDSADAAAALAVVEGLSSDTGYNLSNQIAYSAPLD